MKAVARTIAGAILMFASAVCVLAAATVWETAISGVALFIVTGALYFLLGLYFLFFEKDKPSN